MNRLHVRMNIILVKPKLLKFKNHVYHNQKCDKCKHTRAIPKVFGLDILNTNIFHSLNISKTHIFVHMLQYCLKPYRAVNCKIKTCTLLTDVLADVVFVICPVVCVENNLRQTFLVFLCPNRNTPFFVFVVI